MALDMSTQSSNIILPPEVSSQIWQDAQAASVVMQKATRIDLPGEGIDVPLITGDPTASWLGETDEISVGKSTFGQKHIRPRKVALIEMFSNEFKRDLPGLYAALAERLPKTIAKAYDTKVFHGVAEANAFDSLAGAQALGLASVTAFDDLVDIDSAIYEANGTPDGYVFAPKARKVLIGAKDDNGNPLLLNSITDSRSVPTLLGTDVEYAASAYKADAAGDQGEVLGFGGQWAGNAFYGNVQGISVSVSTDAVINTGTSADPDYVSLFQRDMFALRVVAHLGFAVRDLSKFVKIVGPNTVV